LEVESEYRFTFTQSEVELIIQALRDSGDSMAKELADRIRQEKEFQDLYEEW